MAGYHRQEAEKKRRREAMMRNHPPQNPRENVSVVLTRKEVPKQHAVPLRSSNTNPREGVKNAIQLTEAGKVHEKVRAQLEAAKSPHDRAFAYQAAEGWKRFQTDEGNRMLRRKDPGYQRWQSISGYGELDDWTYKPASNWSVSENNTFGYLYGQDKKRAYDYAKTINTRLSGQMENIGSSLREGAQEQWEKTSDFFEGVWNTHTKAQEQNSLAQQKNAETMSDLWKSIGNGIKAGAQASAQVEIARAEKNRIVGDDTAKAVKQAVRTAWEEQVEIERNNSEQQILRGKHQAERIGELGHTWGKTTGVTGSDQTGASIHGYREDTSYKEPSEEWTDGENRLYEYWLKNNPKEAERYAIRTNDRHNQMQKQKSMDEERQRMNEKEVLALEAGGARLLSGLKSLDGYNSMLEYSATGRISTSPEITPGEYSQLIDDTIADKIERNGGKLASDVYRFGTAAVDGISTYAIGGPVLDVLRTAGESATDTLKREKQRGATDKQAAERAFFKSAGNAAIDAAVGNVFDKKYIKDAKGKDKLKNEVTHIAENLARTSFQSAFDYVEQVQKYKEKGYSEKQAQHIAINEVLMSGGGELLDNIGLDFSQRRFKESLERAMERKK